ncbi:MAG TPA: alpha/beta hydrolase [Bryobacteraceae bacterium]|jgi:alpha-L-fucosidase 2
MTRLIPLLLLAAAPALAGLRSDIEFANVDGVSLTMDASVPDGPGPFPTAILVHGGGWNHGDKQNTFYPMFPPLTQAGFVWFTVNYRLVPKYLYPVEVDDVVLAIRYIEAHARDFKVDLNRVAISGESAGGHIVAMIGARYADELRVKAVVPFYPPADFVSLVDGPHRMERAVGPVMKFVGATAMNDDARKRLAEASPVTYIHKGMPPYLIIAGTGDDLVGFRQSQLLCDKMKETGNSCEIYPLEGAPHWLVNWENHPEWQGYKQKVVDWLKEKLK